MVLTEHGCVFNHHADSIFSILLQDEMTNFLNPNVNPWHCLDELAF